MENFDSGLLLQTLRRSVVCLYVGYNNRELCING